MYIQEIPFVQGPAGGPPDGILRQLLSSDPAPRGRPGGQVVLLASCGSAYKTHGFLLASMSPHFRKMLEHHNDSLPMITDLPEPVLRCLLTWLHQGQLPDPCDPLLACLIAAARRYDLPTLKKQAEACLVAAGADDDPIMSTDGETRKRVCQEPESTVLPPKKRRRCSSNSSLDHWIHQWSSSHALGRQSFIELEI